MTTQDEAFTGQSTMSMNLVIQVAFWVIAAMLTYSAVVSRVSVVESQVGQTERRLRGVGLLHHEQLRRSVGRGPVARGERHL